ncbi:6-pyruvoyl trahydropterin synthase family protein [Lyngbya confervoides]|uniref:6-carboxy-5,6,7,8-tetrahydropterin synthase n=1 Tax=Lyngbya confervoides BDU141951 TaxID=1574623 RepID=A0ABD4T6J6_9CYAN|nr:6-carboxytetrahydropterin synthase [Lyngbya confervoides]MCM1984086.1 6-carboxytetrahydropterin synthase [Lyngbya confervoides BDU141951]
MYTIQIQHNIEAAHRFSQATASPKCRSIHGHSWVITLTLRSQSLNAENMVLEFGLLKRSWRGWLDAHLDHALLLHEQDPMVGAVRAVEAGSKIFTLPHDPTTEVLAACLHDRAEHLLQDLAPNVPIQVLRVHVQETHVNAAAYEIE